MSTIMNQDKTKNNHDINQILPADNNFGKELWDELKYLRKRRMGKHARRNMKRLDSPVATFSKPERLRNKMGLEITLIFRSIACSWARSESGGCTMCGYWNDRASDDLTQENLWNQFEKGISRNEEILENKENEIVFKMFSSGSFCDTKEFTKDLQVKIIRKLCEFPTVKEIVIESRPEYVSNEVLSMYQKVISDMNREQGGENPVYLEVGIGAETYSDFIRQNMINKGFSWESFVKATNRLHKYGFGCKAYLLFKPPFVSEYAAMVELKRTLRACLEEDVDTISINPTNIQKNTICDELERRHSYRPPWFYSLFKVIKSEITPKDLKKTRIISDPSAAGKSRGIHNCRPRDETNDKCVEILKEFVHTQDLAVIPDNFINDVCWDDYLHEIFLS